MSEQRKFEKENAPSVGSLNAKVLKIMSDGKFRVPWEICLILLKEHSLRVSDSSLTARIRDLKKSKYGSHPVEKRRVPDSSAYEYRIAVEEK